jgi:DnaJ-domain-containing protein 1
VSRAMSQTPFDVLGVPHDADERTLRSAYRQLARVYHPDRHTTADRAEANDRMAEINWAWDELRHNRTQWCADAANHASAIARGPADEHEWHAWQEWREFTKQYRRPGGQILGWRRWFGSDVLCCECGCVLSTYVYKCPDCGAVDAWKRSKLHRRT